MIRLKGKTIKNTAEMRRELLDTLEKLDAGEISPAEANKVASDAAKVNHDLEKRLKAAERAAAKPSQPARTYSHEEITEMMRMAGASPDDPDWRASFVKRLEDHQRHIARLMKRSTAPRKAVSK